MITVVHLKLHYKWFLIEEKLSQTKVHPYTYSHSTIYIYIHTCTYTHINVQLREINCTICSSTGL